MSHFRLHVGFLQARTNRILLYYIDI